jgi:hypothetical protein
MIPAAMALTIVLISSDPESFRPLVRPSCPQNVDAGVQVLLDLPGYSETP